MEKEEIIVESSKTGFEIVDFGLSPYRKMWHTQQDAFNRLVECKRQKRKIDTEYIFIGEHEPVYTLGFHGNENNLLATESRLAAMGAECIRIERGGDITYHGPGQLIVYPILDLERHGWGVKEYMSKLEESVIALLAEYGVKGERVDGATGVWIGVGTASERKICAMGVKCRRFVTMHGLALNINTDLSAFSLINPCGFVDKGVTSLQCELGREVPMEEIKTNFIKIMSGLLSK